MSARHRPRMRLEDTGCQRVLFTLASRTRMVVSVLGHPAAGYAAAVTDSTGSRAVTTNGSPTPGDAPSYPRVVGPGLLLGFGLGGFVDGILLHQVLQWHHMVTGSGPDAARYPDTTVEGLRVNTLLDGVFHAATWAWVVLGVVGLWLRLRGARHALPVAALVGLLLAGWGVFNVVEGVLNHHLLGLHHVRSGAHQTAYDLAFLALGVMLAVGGWLVYRSAARRLP